jgi:hypothetical protein
VTRAEEIADLKRKAKARDGVPGHRQNVAEIRARIADLEAEEVQEAENGG